MRLYYSPGASSLAPHLALREAGLAFELVRVNLEDRTTEGRSFLDVNPMGKVPVLELEDGSLLTEGVAILELIADRAGSTLPRHRVTEVLAFIATELHKGFAPMFEPDVPASYKKHLMSNPRPMQRVAALLESGPYLFGETFGVADAYLYAILRLGRHAGLDFSAWPHVEAYLDRVAARESTRAATRAEGLLAG
ncbi:MAG: glutathione binding-like protein [Labilithrix sp.]